MDQFNHIKSLFEKHISGNASDADEVALYEAMEQYSHEELADVLETIAAEKQPDPDFREADWEAAIQRILKTRPEAGRSALIRFMKNNKWWAAASILALLSISLYFRFMGKPVDAGAQKVAVAISEDVPPGGNKAFLTLGNGKIIMLDSTGNGSLAYQGSTKILKVDNNLLSYQSASTGNPVRTFYNTLTTPPGGQYKIMLPDGTLVWLNAASSITYPTSFLGKERKVSMTGEAYFEVAKDKNRPFHVNASRMDVQVLGTHFNINAYTDEQDIKTTLLEGSIKVTNAGNVRMLQPGQQALIRDAKMKIVNDADLDEVVAWKNGKFNFGEKASIEMIMRQIARWYDVDVEYKGVIEGHIGGSISRNVNLSKVLNMLATAGEVKFIQNGKKVTVMP